MTSRARQTADGTRFVDAAGDTMTGDLNVPRLVIPRKTWASIQSFGTTNKDWSLYSEVANNTDTVSVLNITDGLENIRFEGAGGVFLPHGRLRFPATQNPSSNANTLDDYEEGTWTPTFGRSSVNPTVSYTAQVGWYIKIGRLVTVYCDVEADSISGGSGVAYVRGLPFVSANLGRNYPVPTFRDCNAVASGGANTMLVGFVDNAADYIHLQFNGINGAYGTSGSCSWNGSGRVTLSVTYYAAN